MICREKYGPHCFLGLDVSQSEGDIDATIERRKQVAICHRLTSLSALFEYSLNYRLFCLSDSSG
jgi:hypothetical protein